MVSTADRPTEGSIPLTLTCYHVTEVQVAQQPSNRSSVVYAGRKARHKAAGPSPASAAAGAAGPSSKLDVFLSGRKGTGRGAAAAPSKAQLIEQQQQREQQRLLERKLKKQFLSAKVSQCSLVLLGTTSVTGTTLDRFEIT